MNYAFLTFITKCLRFEFVTANILTTYEKKKEKTIPYHFKLSVSNVARIIIDATVCFQSYYLPIPFGEWNLPCITILIQSAWTCLDKKTPIYVGVSNHNVQTSLLKYSLQENAYIQKRIHIYWSRHTYLPKRWIVKCTSFGQIDICIQLCVYACLYLLIFRESDLAQLTNWPYISSILEIL